MMPIVSASGSDDMDDVPWDPTELFLDIGMLVTEARIPDTSPKGRIEGPHVHPQQGSNPHRCDKHREQVNHIQIPQGEDRGAPRTPTAGE